MTEHWDMDGEYLLRSKCNKFKTDVKYWEMYEQKGVHIEILDSSDEVLHFFSIILERNTTKNVKNIFGNRQD